MAIMNFSITSTSEGDSSWSGTGNKGSELDLAGLVCNKLGNHQCINPKKGMEGGDTWEKRFEDLEKMGEESNVAQDG